MSRQFQSGTTIVTDAEGGPPRRSRHFSGVVKSSLRATQVDASTHIAPKPCVVVMPLDASQHSNYCIHYYIEFIHKPQNMVYVCYVTEDFLRKKKPSTDEEANKKSKAKRSISSYLKRKFHTVDMGPSPGVVAEMEQKDRAQCQLVKSKVRDLFTTNGVKYEFHLLTGGEPSTAILDFRNEVSGSLILMGSKGHGSLKRSIFGSVSDKVLKNSSVPVLVVKQTLPHSSYVVIRGIPESLIH
ncbi:hypothetical protein Btru_075442 [Bulinus truncatus]|nr:hypothetical protein Btru_075442 [Bulinus truncatus]